MNEEAEGHKIRSRAKWIEDGEKPTRYFFGLEKSRQNNNTITKLKDDTILTEDIEILDEARTFYQDLYTAELTNPLDQTWLLQQLEKSLSEEDKESCEGSMTEKETTEAVKEITRT